MSAAGETGTTPGTTGGADPRPGFSSRWTPLPEHCTALAPATLPPGFRAAGVAAGIKPSGGADVALLVCDSKDATSAARFTRSGTQAAPVLVTRERCRLDALRAVAINSGNANAATGNLGYQEAARMQGAAAMACGVSEDQVAVCSTGVIGVQLDGRAVVKGLAQAAHELRPDGADDFQAAIETTDLFSKRAAPQRRAARRHGDAQRAVQGRGDDPAELRDDAVLRRDRRGPVRRDRRPAARRLRQALVRPHLRRRPAVDQRHGDPDRRRRERRRRRPRERIGGPLRRGARHAAAPPRARSRPRRRGRAPRRPRDRARRPRPERRARRARGRKFTARQDGALRRRRELGPDRPGRRHGAARLRAAAARHRDRGHAGLRRRARRCVTTRRRCQSACQGEEIEYEIGLPGEGNETEVFFSDLGHEYIRINAEYTT